MPSMFYFEYAKNAERPTAKLWLQDDDGTLIDFSDAGYTWSLKIGTLGASALLTKTAGITGAAGAGEEPSGTPNVVIAWSAGELNIAVGTHDAVLVATITSLDRTFYGKVKILQTIT